MSTETARLLPPVNSLEPSGTSRQAITLSFDNVGYSVPTKDAGRKTILSSVSGVVRPGQLLAIIGPSGAGKSTLLDVLADRKDPANVSGSVLVNGMAPTKAMRRLSAYVMQSDIMRSNLTVFETLFFSAQLRLPSSIPTEQKIQRVEDVMQELGIAHIAKSLIGGVNKRGISGGELKRVSIGIELITDPALILLDEPTSGLDASNSLSVMRVLRLLASTSLDGHPRTLACTIHQPRSSIFGLFDKLMVLARGRVVFCGDARDAVGYFTKLGYACPSYTNPADYFLDLVTNPTTATETVIKVTGNAADARMDFEEPPRADIDALIAAYEKSEDSRRMHASVDKDPASGYQRNTQAPIMAISEYATSGLHQLKVLTALQFRNMAREPMLTTVLLFQTVFIGVIVGLLYLQVGDGQASVQDRLGALFFLVANNAFTQQRFVLIFDQERAVFLREREAGAYRVSAFFIAKTLADLPSLIVFPAAMSSIAYFMIGFRSDAAIFLKFTLGLMMQANAAAAYFTFFAAAFTSVTIGSVVSTIILLVLMLSGGFFSNSGSTPVFLDWVKYVSFFYHSFGAVAKNEFEGAEFTCEDNEPCPYPDGDTVLRTFGFEDVDFYDNMLYLALMVIGYRIMAYVCLLRLKQAT